IGTATITVRATDTFGATFDSSFTVSVADRAPIAGVSLNTSAPPRSSTLTATATKSDPDGDPVTLDYVWKVGSNTVKTTTNSTATTDTLDLSTISPLNKNDQVTVTVTPHDNNMAGTPVTAAATVAGTAPTATVMLDTTSPKTNDILTATVNTNDIDGDNP